jgi:hypothetical protein
MMNSNGMPPSKGTPNLENNYNEVDAGASAANDNDGATMSSDSGSTDGKRTLRSQLGTIVSDVSDSINNNLIMARYGIVGSITILTLYGLSQTPLFFRYRTLSEIPEKYFLQRRSIYCRVVNVVTTGSQQQSSHQQQQQQPIQLIVRHLSPVERLLSKSTLDFVMRYYPSRSVQKLSISTSSQSKDYDSDLFTIQLPGIVTPPTPATRFLDKSLYQPPIIYGLNNDVYNIVGTNKRMENIQQEWLNRWKTEKHTIQCKLLAKIRTVEKDESIRVGRNKRPIPEFIADDTTSRVSSCFAIGIVSYWMQPYNLFTNIELSEALVRKGHAFVSSNGMYETTSGQNENVIEVVSTKVQHLRNDVSYLERLHKAEFDACKGLSGVWANESIRTARKDIIEEVEFQSSATILSKLWRWLRGG